MIKEKLEAFLGKSKEDLEEIKKKQAQFHFYFREENYNYMDIEIYQGELLSLTPVSIIELKYEEDELISIKFVGMTENDSDTREFNLKTKDRKELKLRSQQIIQYKFPDQIIIEEAEEEKTEATEEK